MRVVSAASDQDLFLEPLINISYLLRRFAFGVPFVGGFAFGAGVGVRNELGDWRRAYPNAKGGERGSGQGERVAAPGPVNGDCRWRVKRFGDGRGGGDGLELFKKGAGNDQASGCRFPRYVDH